MKTKELEFSSIGQVFNRYLPNDLEIEQDEEQVDTFSSGEEIAEELLRDFKKTINK
jgi:hypothetical protein